MARTLGNGPALLAVALAAGFVLAHITCAPSASVGTAERPATVAGRPATAGGEPAAAPGQPAAAPGEPAAASGPAGATEGPGAFDPLRTGEVLRRRPPGTALPDTIGTLMPRRIEGAAASPSVDSYLLYLPPGLGERAGQPAGDGRGEWPLILYLHGRSLRGSDLERVKRYGLPSLLERGWDVPFLVVAPQLPDGQYWGDPDRLVKLVEEVAERYPVDEDRIYLTGFSLGAGGVWELLGGHADRFGAAVPISAWTPAPGNGWVESVNELPIRLYHGTEDEPAPYERALRMYEHLRAAGARIELVSLPGEGHGIVQEVYGDPGLYRWLLRHRRE